MREGKPYFATYNLHSDRKGKFERIEFTPEIEKYIIRRVIYIKPGDAVDYFDNAAKAIGIIFMHFPDQKTMIEAEENMDRYVNIVLRGDTV